MTVKSDRWIRRMAAAAQLTQPFNPQLVREIEGRRIISAGASSYYSSKFHLHRVGSFSIFLGEQQDK
ncbi:MAG TPA: hypothetical protein VF544_07690 [Pyrinomonadaceae bacterium]